ncbi:hypothetical protein P8452_01843 [Trifolium repens]|nr:hypothetical protein P8452_01843 [Trifolium repens]
MYGIPLHAWGESTFRMLASKCGIFVEVDAGTRNMERFDSARVKVIAPLCEQIDFNIKLVIQGARFFVRVVEETSILVQDDGGVEDQFRQSEVGSSCASGGFFPVRAVLEGLDEAVSDSEGSEECQQNLHREVEHGNRSKGYNQDMRNDGDKAGGGSGCVMVIPSIGEKVKETDEIRMVDTQSGIRGFPSACHVEEFDSVTVTVEGRHVKCVAGMDSKLVQNVSGPGQAIILDGSKESGGACSETKGCNPGLDSVVGQEEVQKQNDLLFTSNGEVELVTGHKCVVVDQHSNFPRGVHGEVSSFLSESISVPHSTSQMQNRKQGKTHKAPTPFPSLFGPKCLLFAGVINNCNQLQKKRRDSREAASTSSNCQLQDVAEACRPPELGGDPVNSTADEGTQQGVIVHHQDPQGLELAVCC